MHELKNILKTLQAVIYSVAYTEIRDKNSQHY